MRSLSALFCLLVFSSSAQVDTSQIVNENSILKCAVKKRGVYRTFEEFKYNNPSDTLKDFIVEMTNKDPERYDMFATVNGKRKKIKKGIWGFCDGQDAFVSTTNFHRQNLWYLKLIEYGKVCICTDIMTTNLGMYGLAGGVVNAVHVSNLSNAYGDKHYDLAGLNIKDGKFFEVNPTTFQNRVLSLDKELLDKYNKEDGKSRKLLEYIVEFNNRYEKSHPDYWK